MWGVLLVVLLLGCFLGTVLTYGTVIAPRRRELGRLAQGGGGYPETVVLERLVGAVSPDEHVVFQDLAMDRASPGGRVVHRTARTRLTVSGQDKEGFMLRLRAGFAQDLAQRGRPPTQTKTHVEAFGPNRVFSDEFTYDVSGGVTGTVQVWAIANGDEIELWVSIHEP